MFYERFKQLCDENDTTPSAVCKELGISNSASTYWKRGSIPKADKLTQIAGYFNVPVDYLQGKGTKTNPAITDRDIKFALFHGEDGITDEMYAEVKQFADMVLMREKSKKESGNK